MDDNDVTDHTTQPLKETKLHNTFFQGVFDNIYLFKIQTIYLINRV